MKTFKMYVETSSLSSRHSRLCRSRKILKNKELPLNIGVDTAENILSKVWGREGLSHRQQNLTLIYECLIYSFRFWGGTVQHAQHLQI